MQSQPIHPESQQEEKQSHDNAFEDHPSVQRNETHDSIHTNYQLIEKIGHGTQGTIFKARRLKDDQIVAIKQFNIQSVKTWKEYELFQREARVLESIRMDGVAKFYETIECHDDEPPCAYIVQE